MTSNPKTIKQKQKYQYQRIYLDSAGGTQMYNSSKHELMKYLDIVNPAHEDDLTKEAKTKYKKLLKLLVDISVQSVGNRKQYESIITGGGSESNNLLIKSVICSVYCQQQNQIKQSKSLSDKNQIPHVIISAYEHKSIVKCVEQLVQENKILLTKIAPRIDGSIHSKDVIQAITKNTILISIMSVNNENGINNTAELKKIGQYLKSNKLTIYFHSDNVQSFCKYQCYMDDIGLDAISCSFYKLYAPGKIGAIVINTTKLKKIIQQFPLINGTLLEHQNNHGGTLPLSLCSASLNSLNVTHNNRQNKNIRLQFLKLYFIKEMSNKFKIVEFADDTIDIIHKNSPDWIFVNFSPIDKSVPHITFFTLIRSIGVGGKQHVLDGVCGQKMKDYLFQNNIVVSNGSNCGNASDQYVLNSYKVPSKLQQGAVRVSISDTTIRYELQKIAQQIQYYISNVYKDITKKKQIH